MNRHLYRAARALHRFSFLRRAARLLARGRTVTQPFHGGSICLDAVEHSWAWTGDRRLEDFERPVQDRLVELTASRPLFIDLGCNIGVMTLSVLLRRPGTRSVSVDANARAAALLRQSLRVNRLESRAEVLATAVSAGAPSLAFAPEGSFTGHARADGNLVPAVPLATLLARHATGPCVIKLDLEGYEAELAGCLATLPALPGSVLVIELHPRGFNQLGDPLKVLDALRGRGDLRISLLGGAGLGEIDPTHFTQIEAHWPA